MMRELYSLIENVRQWLSVCVTKLRIEDYILFSNYVDIFVSKRFMESKFLEEALESEPAFSKAVAYLANSGRTVATTAPRADITAFIEGLSKVARKNGYDNFLHVGQIDVHLKNDGFMFTMKDRPIYMLFMQEDSFVVHCSKEGKGFCQRLSDMFELGIKVSWYDEVTFDFEGVLKPSLSTQRDKVLEQSLKRLEAVLRVCDNTLRIGKYCYCWYRESVCVEVKTNTFPVPLVLGDVPEIEPLVNGFSQNLKQLDDNETVFAALAVIEKTVSGETATVAVHKYQSRELQGIGLCSHYGELEAVYIVLKQKLFYYTLEGHSSDIMYCTDLGADGDSTRLLCLPETDKESSQFNNYDNWLAGRQLVTLLLNYTTERINIAGREVHNSLGYITPEGDFDGDAKREYALRSDTQFFSAICAIGESTLRLNSKKQVDTIRNAFSVASKIGCRRTPVTSFRVRDWRKYSVVMAISADRELYAAIVLFNKDLALCYCSKGYEDILTAYHDNLHFDKIRNDFNSSVRQFAHVKSSVKRKAITKKPADVPATESVADTSKLENIFTMGEMHPGSGCKVLDAQMGIRLLTEVLTATKSKLCLGEYAFGLTDGVLYAETRAGTTERAEVLVKSDRNLDELLKHVDKTFSMSKPCSWQSKTNEILKKELNTQPKRDQDVIKICRPALTCNALVAYTSHGQLLIALLCSDVGIRYYVSPNTDNVLKYLGLRYHPTDADELLKAKCKVYADVPVTVPASKSPTVPEPEAAVKVVGDEFDRLGAAMAEHGFTQPGDVLREVFRAMKLVNKSAMGVNRVIDLYKKDLGWEIK